MNLPQFSVNKPVTITMLILIIVLFGIVAFFQLGLDMMPELEFPIVAVVTQYRGVAAEEVEKLVTKPVEEMVSTVNNVKTVYSTSLEGVSSVIVEFNWGVNMDFAAQDVREKLGWAEMFLPDDAETPLVIKFDPSDMPILMYSITGMKDTMSLRKYVDDNVCPILERIPGVAMAVTIGGLEREIHIEVEKNKLEAYGLSINQVINAIRQENINVSAGHIKKAHSEFLIRAVGEYKNLDDIRETILSVRNGAPVRVKDVANVKDSHKEVRHISRSNSKPSVMMIVMKQSGTNTLSVINDVKDSLEELKGTLTEDIDFIAGFDQGDMIGKVVSKTTTNALEGALLAVILIFLFLWNWRPTLTIFIAIPLSVSTVFIGMYALGYTFNFVTLAGIALGIGMLVDNAVVVIENMFRHLEAGKDRKTAAILGASEVGTAITASTFTTVAVFLPMVLVGGLAGKFAQPMALTVCIALIASLFVAVTLVPMVASLLFKRRAKNGGDKSDYGQTQFKKMRTKYRKMLRWVLSHRAIVLISAAVIFFIAISVLAFGILGSEFMPGSDMPMIILQITLPAGTNLDKTDEVVSQIEQYVLTLPEKRLVMAMIGPSEMGSMEAARGTSETDVNQATIMIRLKDRTDRNRLTKEITEDIRAHLPKIEGAVYNFMDMSMAMMSTSADMAPVAIRIFGKEIDKLKEYASIVKEQIEGVEGLKDINVSMKEGKPELQIKPDRTKASQLGLSHPQIASAFSAASMGKVATRLRSGGDEYDVRVRFQESDRDTIEKLKNITIASPMGITVPLYQVAHINYEQGPIEITREEQTRKVTVTANLKKGSKLSLVMAEIDEKLKELKRDLPSGYFINYGGTFSEMTEAFTALWYALIAAIILVYMVMAAQFEHLAHPFVVMFTVPLGVIGVVIGLAMFGMTLSLPAYMGLIILSGIVVNNGIVMIDYVNRLRKQGLGKHEALIEGAATRLRPILITSLTTIFAMLPMGLSQSEGSEIRGPLGVSVAVGLFFAMFLTLFVIPAIYSVVDSISFRITKKARQVVHGEDM